MPLFSILSVCQQLAFSGLLLLGGYTSIASTPTEPSDNDSKKPGSSSPATATTLKGIDVSRWQKDINWELVKDEQVVFSFIKATEGDFRQDPYFSRNWSESKRNGIRRGAYHFFKPQAPIQCQIELFTNSVVLEPGDLPPVLDVEVSDPKVSPAQLRESINTWLEAVTAHYGIKPIIYTSQNYYQRYLKGHFKGYHFWIARYSSVQPEVHHTDSWMFWQHSDRGRITGIKTNVDMNYFLGDVETLSQLCIPDLVASEETSPLQQLKHMYPLP
ncbi:glycoside hydrolase family 25 protein [Pontibacter toksunensis]|uniref:Glycoside hydrolase family 25 protein n=1 Tax=Pontibacter toksunensis TaxID=1332631 RepID=A0ABW6BS49_9BACT